MASTMPFHLAKFPHPDVAECLEYRCAQLHAQLVPASQRSIEASVQKSMNLSRIAQAL
jgi:hypothetical protein